ncbi:hypothetical protein FQN55_004509 [Onygenales sp. PD_40]|nr:hypothetical protein FQN55_004509 [Onygenales sp. PD_40]
MPATLWETFTQLFGDWLVSHQNSDGSYYRAYNLEGTGPENDATYNTIIAVPFLLDLANYTGEVSYRDAAIRAGEFAFETVHTPTTYVGGTDGQGSNRPGAASVPQILNGLGCTPGTIWWYRTARHIRSTGFEVSLIATGHSALDTWYSQSVFDIYQLYRATNDPYSLKFAQLAANNAKLRTQYPGNPLGYSRDGLLEEAIGLADLRYGGVNVWLPWNSVAHAEPLAFLEDAYGNMDINAL